MKIDPNAQPTAHRIHKRGMQKRVGKISGIKFPGVIQVESRMEGALIRCMQIDPRVTSLRPQPCTIDMQTGRIFPSQAALKEHYKDSRYSPKGYTPDLKVELVCGRSAFLDAKHSAHIIKNPTYLEYPKALAKVGIDLTLVTEELLQGPIDTNAWLLLGCLRTKIDEHAVDAVSLLPSGGAQFRDIQSKFGVPKSAILKMVLEGYLAADLVDEVLSPKSTLWASHGDTSHLEVIKF